MVLPGNSLFTLLGYMGLYLVLGILFLFLIQQEIAHGPADTSTVAYLGSLQGGSSSSQER